MPRFFPGGSPLPPAPQKEPPDPLVSLERIATALERLADAVDTKFLHKVISGTGEPTGSVLMQTDSDFFELEQLETRKERAGGSVTIDEDLEKEPLGWEPK